MEDKVVKIVNHEDARKYLDRMEALSKAGYSEKEISEMLGLRTIGLRNFRTVAYTKVKEYLREQAKKMQEAGKSVSEIAKELGKEESTVRLLLEK